LLSLNLSIRSVPMKFSNFYAGRGERIVKELFLFKNNTLNIRKVEDSFVNVCAHLSSNRHLSGNFIYRVCILKHMIFLLAKKCLRSAVLFMALAIGEDIAKIVANIFVFSTRRADLARILQQEKGDIFLLRVAYFYGVHFIQDMKTRRYRAYVERYLYFAFDLYLLSAMFKSAANL